MKRYTETELAILVDDFLDTVTDQVEVSENPTFYEIFLRQVIIKTFNAYLTSPSRDKITFSEFLNKHGY